MYLIRCQLNLSKRKTILALSSPNHFHGALEYAFEERQARNLWRLDYLHGKSYIIILSHSVPDLSSFIFQFGYDNQEPEIKVYDDFLNSIQNGSVWRFRLVANPTYKKNSVVKCHITDVKQMEWLVNKGKQYGFSINENQCFVNGMKWNSFKKRGQYHISFLSVSYEGILQITDKEKFVSAMIFGIGREKSYGNGLITLCK